MPATAPRDIRVHVACGDVLNTPGDVLVLKHAQDLFGVDQAVVGRLRAKQATFGPLPEPGQSLLVPTDRAICADHVLFVGVATLFDFGYPEIREFARQGLTELGKAAFEARTVLFTLHGAGYGLDEREAFRAELTGFLLAVAEGAHPPHLSRVVIVEQDRGRADRLDETLSEVIPGGVIRVSSRTDAERIARETDQKGHVFVAMPFSENMEDVYHFGILPPVNAAGFICERADNSSFTGEVMMWVKHRIETARLVVADLTTANANVYLEVGYAWGCGRPTILLCRNEADIKFDVKGHRYLLYKTIKGLDSALRQELTALLAERNTTDTPGVPAPTSRPDEPR